mmetsp:Transcript_8363/g.18318  ORF Transcript_8363/g.18318 Transcript_8363/m.18318 type:complete len:279 (-) Transcript_8363:93-929(-)
MIVFCFMVLKHQLSVPHGPWLPNHVLRGHQIGHVQVFEPRPQFAPSGAQVEPSHEHLYPNNLSLLQGEAHRDKAVQILRAICVHVLPVVEDKFVYGTKRQGNNPRRLGWNRRAQATNDEDICEDTLHEDIKQIPCTGQTWHEGRIVLHSARREAVPPVGEGRGHLGVQGPMEYAQPQGFPRIPVDHELLHQRHPYHVALRPRKTGAAWCGGKEDATVRAHEDTDHGPVPIEEGVRNPKAAVGGHDALYADVRDGQEALPFHLGFVRGWQASRHVLQEP